MKRLALSLLGGIVIPFVYAIIVGPLSTYIKNESLNHYLSYPVRWPVLLLYRLFLLNVLSNETLLLLIVIGCNVFLYTLLTYCVLLVFLRPKQAELESPPPPVQH
jgi:hypothetical protein